MGLRQDKRSRDRQGAVSPLKSPVLPPASGPPKGIKTPGFRPSGHATRPVGAQHAVPACTRHDALRDVAYKIAKS